MLDKLEDLSRELSDAIATVEWLRAGRDRLIREAIDAGHPAVRVAEAAGVSKQGLYNALARTDTTATSPPNTPQT